MCAVWILKSIHYNLYAICNVCSECTMHAVWTRCVLYTLCIYSLHTQHIVSESIICILYVICNLLQNSVKKTMLYTTSLKQPSLYYTAGLSLYLSWLWNKVLCIDITHIHSYNLLSFLIVNFQSIITIIVILVFSCSLLYNP